MLYYFSHFTSWCNAMFTFIYFHCLYFYVCSISFHVFCCSLFSLSSVRWFVRSCSLLLAVYWISYGKYTSIRSLTLIVEYRTWSMLFTLILCVLNGVNTSPYMDCRLYILHAITPSKLWAQSLPRTSIKRSDRETTQGWLFPPVWRHYFSA